MTRRTLFLLISIVAFAFFTRVWRLHVPERYIFDEVYHVVTAKLIAKNDPRAYEWWHPGPEPNTAIDWLHPPLAKYTQALGILAFGENSFGWRVSSAIFGVGVVILTFALACKLFNEAIGVLAAFLASLDGLLLTQSRIAMNDIHVTFFILLTLLIYQYYLDAQKKTLRVANRWLLLTGISAGLAMGSKWSGLFVLGIIGLWEISQLVAHARISEWRALLLKLTRLILCLGIIPLIVYVASYSHMFGQGKTLFCQRSQAVPNECYYEVIKWGGTELYRGYISHFNMLHRQIWNYQTTLEATHGYQSRPWQWFLDLRPVWYHVVYAPTTITNIYAMGNPTLFWLGDIAIIITLVYLIDLWSKHTFSSKQQALVFVTLSYFLVWLPWQFSPRIMFFYHYTPAVPLLSIILAYWLHEVQKHSVTGKYLALWLIGFIAFTFILWYPNWTAIPVPKDFGESIYFALKSWK